MLKILHLSKSFQEQVLNDISLEIPDKTITVFMGPSGGGKTTLLRILCQLETADHGTILLDNQPIKPQQIGLVFQNYHLFPHWTVLKNLVNAPIYHKLMTKKEAIDKAMTLLEKLQLQDKAHQYPSTLSGGQKQRIAIARACMLNPKILCFDEPTSALDQASIELVKEIIHDLSKTMSIIIVTHDEKFAKDIADHIIYMKDINLLQR